MNIRRHALAVLISACCCLGAAWAGDWPAYRGPTGSGVSGETALNLPAGKESVLWKIKLPGPGASGPIVVKDKVFVTCYTGYGTTLSRGFGKGGFSMGGAKGGFGQGGFGKGGFGKGGFGKGGFGKGGFGGFGKPSPAELAAQEKLRFVLVCLDAAKGDVLWQKEIEPNLPEVPFGGMIREHGYATSTPASDGERVYVFFGKTGVFAFDLAGKRLWHADVGDRTNMFGMAASPVLHGDMVIVNASIESGSLIGLNKNTGKEVWRTKNIGQSWGSPIVVKTAAGRHEIVLSLPGMVAGFDPADGKERWHCKGISIGGGFGGYGGTYSSPAAHGDVVFVSGGGGPAGPPVALAVRAGGKGDVEATHVLWRQKAGTSYTSPVVHGKHVYFIDGSVTCLRADTGKRIYKERLYEGQSEYVSPVAVGDKLVVLTRFDGLFVVAAGAKFEQVGAHEFTGDKSIFNACPAVADGRIYARSNAYLYCLGKR